MNNAQIRGFRKLATNAGTVRIARVTSKRGTESYEVLVMEENGFERCEGATSTLNGALELASIVSKTVAS